MSLENTPWKSGIPPQKPEIGKAQEDMPQAPQWQKGRFLSREYYKISSNKEGDVKITLMRKDVYSRIANWVQGKFSESSEIGKEAGHFIIKRDGSYETEGLLKNRSFNVIPGNKDYIVTFPEGDKRMISKPTPEIKPPTVSRNVESIRDNLIEKANNLNVKIKELKEKLLKKVDPQDKKYETLSKVIVNLEILLNTNEQTINTLNDDKIKLNEDKIEALRKEVESHEKQFEEYKTNSSSLRLRGPKERG